MQESKSEPSLGPAGAQPATEATRACNHAQRRLLPLADTQSFDDARRGFIADIPALAITQPSGAPCLEPENLRFFGRGGST
jgi:alkyl sulfatase BDS1-like metallo-beta-lactamase superfamily hydrolase